MGGERLTTPHLPRYRSDLPFRRRAACGPAWRIGR